MQASQCSQWCCAGLPALKAPALNCTTAAPLVQVPSGKMRVCGQPGSSQRFKIASLATARDSGLLRSTKIDCVQIMKPDKIGNPAYDASASFACRNRYIPSMSPETWLATMMGASSCEAHFPLTGIHQKPKRSMTKREPATTGQKMHCLQVARGLPLSASKSSLPKPQEAILVRIKPTNMKMMKAAILSGSSVNITTMRRNQIPQVG